MEGLRPERAVFKEPPHITLCEEVIVIINIKRRSARLIAVIGLIVALTGPIGIGSASTAFAAGGPAGNGQPSGG